VHGASRAMRSDHRGGMVVGACVCVGLVGIAVGVDVGNGVGVLFQVTR
jgi:hypothetical protein